MGAKHVAAEFDAMIARGEFPPAIIACPDGTYEGDNRRTDHHSLYVNGRGGRFEDHLIREIVPFLFGFILAANLGAAAVPLPAHREVLLTSGPVTGGNLPPDTAAWLCT